MFQHKDADNANGTRYRFSVFPTSTRSQLRGVCPLPIELQDQSTVLIEERLFTQALSLFSSNLTAGFDTGSPAYLPSPQHLALLATLVVHPKLSTGSNSADDSGAADHALRYLRRVVRTVDVRRARLRDAFAFAAGTGRDQRSRKARRRQSIASDGSDKHAIHSPFANHLSLWSCADDFWALVGWSFNCSVRYKQRWERWKHLLQLMLDVLSMELEAVAADNGDFRDTLLARYLSTVGIGRQNKRRVMRAILADGSAKSTGEFHEIWQKETRQPKKRPDEVEEERQGEVKEKRRKLDLDKEEYGDYFDDASDEGSIASRSRTSRSAASTRTRAAPPEANSDDDLDASCDASIDSADFGGVDSVRLRQIFLALLTRFSSLAPSLFIETDDLFDLFTEFLRPLPLSVFQHFVLPLHPYLPPDFHSSLSELLCAPLLGTSRPLGQLITQEVFENEFAPCAATSVSASDHAKLSMLTESLLRALWTDNILRGDTKRLADRVEHGIEARNMMVTGDGRLKAGPRALAEERARASLQFSAARLRLLVAEVLASPSSAEPPSQSPTRHELRA